jgi:hypothetical protein
MANNQSESNQPSDWQNNREMNIKENSAETKDAIHEDAGTEKTGWRPTESSWENDSILQSGGGQSSSQSTGAGAQRAQEQGKTGDPGRTPGKAEGEEDFEESGNQ